MKILVSTAAILLLAHASASAQLYKWVGPDGKVTYSDTPPPPNARQVESKPLPGAAPGSGDLPYDVSRAAASHPVVLYTTRDCSPCNDGRTLLQQRGIPFAEKTVNTAEDVARYRQLNSDGDFPFLTVGRERQRGFEAGAWNTLLSASGYPETSRLPRGFRHSPAQPLAGAPASAPAASAAAPDAAPRNTSPSERNAARAPAPAGTPPGFRF